MKKTKTAKIVIYYFICVLSVLGVLFYMNCEYQSSFSFKSESQLTLEKLKENLNDKRNELEALQFKFRFYKNSIGHRIVAERTPDSYEYEGQNDSEGEFTADAMYEAQEVQECDNEELKRKIDKLSMEYAQLLMQINKLVKELAKKQEISESETKRVFQEKMAHIFFFCSVWLFLMILSKFWIKKMLLNYSPDALEIYDFFESALGLVLMIVFFYIELMPG